MRARSESRLYRDRKYPSLSITIPRDPDCSSPSVLDSCRSTARLIRRPLRRVGARQPILIFHLFFQLRAPRNLQVPPVQAFMNFYCKLPKLGRGFKSHLPNFLHLFFHLPETVLFITTTLRRFPSGFWTFSTGSGACLTKTRGCGHPRQPRAREPR